MKIFCYQLMFNAGFLPLMIIFRIWSLPITSGFLRFFGKFTFFLMILLFYVARFAAAKPSIVLEKKSSFHAFSRSWDLSKGSTCKISFTLLLYRLGVFVVFLILSRIPVIRQILFLF